MGVLRVSCSSSFLGDLIGEADSTTSAGGSGELPSRVPILDASAIQHGYVHHQESWHLFPRFGVRILAAFTPSSASTVPEASPTELQAAAAPLIADAEAAARRLQKQQQAAALTEKAKAKPQVRSWSRQEATQRYERERLARLALKEAEKESRRLSAGYGQFHFGLESENFAHTALPVKGDAHTEPAVKGDVQISSPSTAAAKPSAPPTVPGAPMWTPTHVGIARAMQLSAEFPSTSALPDHEDEMLTPAQAAAGMPYLAGSPAVAEMKMSMTSKVPVSSPKEITAPSPGKDAVEAAGREAVALASALSAPIAKVTAEKFAADLPPALRNSNTIRDGPAGVAREMARLRARLSFM